MKLPTNQIEWNTKEKGANPPEQEEYGGQVAWGVNNGNPICDVRECLQAQYLDENTVKKTVSITYPSNRKKHERKVPEQEECGGQVAWGSTMGTLSAMCVTVCEHDI